MIAYPKPCPASAFAVPASAHEAERRLVGITAVGTLVTLWPTMLRTKMVDKALTHSLRALYLMRWLSGVDRCRRDFLGWSARRSRPGRLPGCPADCRLGDGMCVPWRTKRPNEYPPMSVGMGFLWLIVGV